MVAYLQTFCYVTSHVPLLTAFSTVVTTVPVCHEWSVCSCGLVQCTAVNMRFLLTVFKVRAGIGFP